MHPSLLLVAGALSLGIAGASGELARMLEGSSRLALAALPWVALAGVPPNVREQRLPVRRWPADLALALPILALAAWVDLRLGAAPSALALTGAGALLLVALLGEARRRARAGRVARYALAWACLVPVLPALDAALGGAFGSSSLLAGLSPLAWIWARAELFVTGSAAPGASSRIAALLGPVAAAAMLWFLAAAPVRRAVGEGA